jgi:uncharacterized protein
LVRTPCIRACSIDEASGLYLGCARTLAEITRWSEMTDAERDAVMCALEERKRKQLPRPAG